jgi:hypothetical protein
MDIYCPRCAEPWDIDSLWDEADASGVPFTTVRAAFSRKGCLALESYGVSELDCVRDTGNARAMASGVLMDILGDDIDGVASLMGDAEALGIFRG